LTVEKAESEFTREQCALFVDNLASFAVPAISEWAVINNKGENLVS